MHDPDTSRFLWHYTPKGHLQSIISDGVIRVATALLPTGEKPAVWFSKNQTWERTAGKDYVDTATRQKANTYGAPLEVAARVHGVARIGVAPAVAPHAWVAFRELSGIAPKEARQLAKVARARYADPNDWYVSFEPVPRALWARVELYREGLWLDVGLNGERFE